MLMFSQNNVYVSPSGVRTLTFNNTVKYSWGQIRPKHFPYCDRIASRFLNPSWDSNLTPEKMLSSQWVFRSEEKGKVFPVGSRCWWDMIPVQCVSSQNSCHPSFIDSSASRYVYFDINNHVPSLSVCQGCYFCVKQYALECSRIPMGQTVNSQVNAWQNSASHVGGQVRWFLFVPGFNSRIQGRSETTGQGFQGYFHGCLVSSYFEWLSRLCNSV